MSKRAVGDLQLGAAITMIVGNKAGENTRCKLSAVRVAINHTTYVTPAVNAVRSAVDHATATLGAVAEPVIPEDFVSVVTVGVVCGAIFAENVYPVE